MFLTFYKVLFSDSSRTFFINMSNEIEIWKDIPNYEGLYQASNLGRIRSLGNNRFKNPKILKCGIGLTGYKRVMLYGFGKRKEYSVHKLIAFTFLNHFSCGYLLVIDHINGDKLNNNLSNLQIVTQRYNASKDRKGVSKYTGVVWCKDYNKWRSRIRINGRLIHLGRFEYEIEASKAYQKALAEIEQIKKAKNL